MANIDSGPAAKLNQIVQKKIKIAVDHMIQSCNGSAGNRSKYFSRGTG